MDAIVEIFNAVLLFLICCDGLRALLELPGDLWYARHEIWDFIKFVLMLE